MPAIIMSIICMWVSQCMLLLYHHDYLHGVDDVDGEPRILPSRVHMCVCSIEWPFDGPMIVCCLLPPQVIHTV